MFAEETILYKPFI